jgi:type IV pilus assembly protein PilC
MHCTSQASDMAGIDLKLIKKEHQTAEKQGGQATAIADFLNRDIKIFSTGFSDKKKEQFYSELTTLLSAGIDIQSALELLSESFEKEKDKQMIDEIRKRVEEGDTFSEALNKSSKVSGYEFYSLQIGEEAGKMIETLQEISKYFSKKTKLKRQMVSALSYPGIVLLVSVGAIVFMLKMVVPMFENLFKRFKGELPSLTKVVIHLSKLVSTYFLAVILMAVIVIVFFYLQRKKAWFRNYSSKIVLRIPIFGEMIRKIYIARFCNSMALLISSKANLVNALELVGKMIGFYPLEVTIGPIRDDIVYKGHSLHQAMGQYPIYGKRMASLIKVGEEVNKLEDMFGKVAQQYTEEVEHQSEILGSLLEPFMIIFLGLIVGIIIVAMYLPMFKLSSSFNY